MKLEIYALCMVKNYIIFLAIVHPIELCGQGLAERFLPACAVNLAFHELRTTSKFPQVITGNGNSTSSTVSE